MQYWLMKSEPDVYGLDHLRKERIDHWDGIRNYQARNYMRDEMQKGDLAFFYHSSCDEPGIVGIMKVNKKAYPDFTAFDPKEKYYDPKSDPANPRWLMVDVRYVRKLKRPISLKELKLHKNLDNMRLLQRGNRLSILPVTKKEWNYILKLEDKSTKQ
jgi:predicted RNA-binding protein with PUA-like domain